MIDTHIETRYVFLMFNQIFQKIAVIMGKSAVLLTFLKDFSHQVMVALYLKVSLLQCNYTLMYWVILIKNMYLL